MSDPGVPHSPIITIKTHNGRPLRVSKLTKMPIASVSTYHNFKSSIRPRGRHRAHNAIHALAQVIAALEKDPGLTGEFAINESLSLRSEPPGFLLSKCNVSYKFLALENLRALYERIQETALIAQLFG